MAIDNTLLIRELTRLRPNLLAYIVSIVGDEHLGEDLLQDVCVAAYENRDSVKDAGHLAGWLRVAARNASLNAIRNRVGRQTLDPSVLDLMEGHWEQYDGADHGDAILALRKGVDDLTPYARQLVNLRYAEGLTGQRLADRLDKKVPTVYMALTRAHKALAECVRLRLAGEEM